MQPDIDPQFVERMLRCPATRQPLRVAPSELVEALNRRIEGGELSNIGGEVVLERLQGGLIRDDRTVLYPVVDDIPKLLIDEGIALGGDESAPTPPTSA